MRISDWSSDVCSSDLQYVDLLNGLLERVQFGEVDGGQIAGLIGQVLRLVLEHADLIVDLLQRPGSGQDILAVIGRIEHGPLCVYRLARHHHAHHQGAGSAEAERGTDPLFTRKQAPKRAPWIGDWGKSASRSAANLRSAEDRKNSSH